MKKITVCRLCSACCPVEVEISDGKLLSAKRITPFEKVIPCPKLSNTSKIVYSKDRVLKPLLRKNLNDDFKESYWQEALDFIAEKIEKIKEKYSSESIALYRGMAADWGTPWDYAVRLLSAIGSPNAIGNGSVCFVARNMAHTYTYGAITIPQVKDSKCIIVWGKNDRNTLPTIAEAIIYAKEKGAFLIVIDPTKTYFAEMADLWIQIKPGHDGLLALGIIKEIIENKLYDKEFVEKHCIGFEALEKTVKSLNTSEITEKTGITEDKIKKLARIYATTKPACIIDGNGLDMHINVFQTTRAIAILRALTGNLDIQGGDFIPQPIPLRNIQLKEKVSHVPSVMKDYPLFERFHPTWGLHGQSCLIDAILYEKPYPVRVLFVQSGNPAVTMMGSQRVREALKKLDCLVMIDMFKNKTSEFAHLILPAASCFEKTQINRAYVRNCFIMLQQKVIEPLGESKGDIDILIEIGKALGLKEYFPWNSSEEALNYQLEPTGITIDELKNNPNGIWYEKPRFKKYETEGFNTPSKKVEMYSERLAKANIEPIPFMKEFPKKLLSFEEQRENYPFIGISGKRVNCYTHTQFRHVEELRKIEKEPYVDIHLSDAELLNIKNEDFVRISTPNGYVEMKARISDAVSKGVIRIAWGWGEISDKWNLNSLTDDFDRDPVTSTPSGRTFYCRIEKI